MESVTSSGQTSVLSVLYGGKGEQPGNAAPWPSSFSTSTLNGTNGFQINVFPPNAGSMPLAIGDFNGDGYGDIIIGWPTAGGSKAKGDINYQAQPTAGHYVTFNGSNWTFVTSGATGDQTNIQATAGATWAQLVSDLNASADPNISVATYSGGMFQLQITATTYGPGSAGPPATGNYYTFSCGTVPCVGYITGGPNLVGGNGSPGVVNEGATYVIFGGPDVGGVHTMKDGTTSWATSQTLASGTAPLNGTDGVEFDGATTGIASGTSVALGDVNGDGIKDLIIGAPAALPVGANYYGSVYVVFGKPASSAWTTPQTLNAALFNSGAGGFELDGTGTSYLWGQGVTTGDVNGDGIADILTFEWNTGVGVIYGGSGPTSGSWSGTPYSLNTNGTGILNGSSGFCLKATGWGTYSSVGCHLAVADVNGDGYADIISGNTEGVDNNPLIFGKSGSWPASTNVATGNWLNGYNGSDFTSTFSTTAWAGDINGDGIPDLIFSSSSSITNGSVYIFFGHKNSINNPWPTSSFNLNGL